MAQQSAIPEKTIRLNDTKNADERER